MKEEGLRGQRATSLEVQVPRGLGNIPGPGSLRIRRTKLSLTRGSLNYRPGPDYKEAKSQPAGEAGSSGSKNHQDPLFPITTGLLQSQPPPGARSPRAPSPPPSSVLSFTLIGPALVTCPPSSLRLHL